MEILLAIVKIIAGFAVLVWGAERFVHGAAGTAKNLGVSTLVIGLTIVGFGTSAPEILVSITAAINGNPGLAVGNALGSNITNIGLVLGTTALIFPLVVSSRILKREFPILLATMGLGLILLWDNHLSRLDGSILLGVLAFITIWLVRVGMTPSGMEPLSTEMEKEIPKIPLSRAIFWTVVGLLLLLGSSQILVDGAVSLATIYGVSDMIIGLTIVAIGTSLPELAASLASAFKKEPDMAIGNIIGSNMFNLLAVLGIPGLVSPITLEADTISRDYSVMLGLTVLLFIFAYGFRKPGHISRLEGALILTGYLAYMVVLYLSIHR